jgi:hypothetical protein
MLATVAKDCVEIEMLTLNRCPYHHHHYRHHHHYYRHHLHRGRLLHHRLSASIAPRTMGRRVQRALQVDAMRAQQEEAR